jgi:putative DNA primase/helicase
MNNINFSVVKNSLRGHEYTILLQLLPKGKKEGNEYVSLNPTRNDRNLGSFRINTTTWRWADFATNDRGRDIISLYAYIKGVNQLTAAKELLTITGGGYHD